jgi:hypothetical protein
MRDGIVAIQLAGNAEAVQEIIGSWDGPLLVRAGFSLGLDYLFMVAYATTIALACLWGASVLGPKFGWLASTGELLAWGAWIAASLDAIENAAVLRQLLFGAASPWAETACWAATLKFTLIVLGLLYVIGAITFWIATRLRNSVMA